MSLHIWMNCRSCFTILDGTVPTRDCMHLLYLFIHVARYHLRNIWSSSMVKWHEENIKLPVFLFGAMTDTRYLYWPLGGKNRTWLAVPVVFLFVGFWHERTGHLENMRHARNMCWNELTTWRCWKIWSFASLVKKRWSPSLKTMDATNLPEKYILGNTRGHHSYWFETVVLTWITHALWSNVYIFWIRCCFSFSYRHVLKNLSKKRKMCCFFAFTPWKNYRLEPESFLTKIWKRKSIWSIHLPVLGGERFLAVHFPGVYGSKLHPRIWNTTCLVCLGYLECNGGSLVRQLDVWIFNKGGRRRPLQKNIQYPPWN